MTKNSLVSRLGLGRLAYHLWHRHVGPVRDSLAAGGPWQVRRTRQAEEAMIAAAKMLPPPTNGIGEAVVLHLLTGRRFWHQTAFCLWTFAQQSGRPLAPFLYDDGTLEQEHRTALTRLFPHATIVAQSETQARLNEVLPLARFPSLRDRWLHYPNLRKLIDPHIGSTGWKLVLDSDLLFFRKPDFLLAWIAQPDRPLHAVDCETSYGYPADMLAELAGSSLAPLVNVGLCGLRSDDLDWERLEFWCRELLSRQGHHYFLEQALVAMLLARRACAVAPAADYVTLPQAPATPERGAVMHHYVAHSKRWYFQHDWRGVHRLAVSVTP